MSAIKKFFSLFQTTLFMGASTGVQMAKRGIISPEEAYQLQEESGVFVDVRSDKEVADGMLPGAIHIPHTEVASRVNELQSYKDQHVVVYCAVGGRAEAARGDLEQAGFRSVHNAGGYQDLHAYAKKAGKIS